MKNKFFSVFFSICLLVVALPAMPLTAAAAEETAHAADGSIKTTRTKPLRFNGTAIYAESDATDSTSLGNPQEVGVIDMLATEGWKFERTATDITLTLDGLDLGNTLTVDHKTNGENVTVVLTKNSVNFVKTDVGSPYIGTTGVLAITGGGRLTTAASNNMNAITFTGVAGIVFENCSITADGSAYTASTTGDAPRGMSIYSKNTILIKNSMIEGIAGTSHLASTTFNVGIVFQPFEKIAPVVKISGNTELKGTSGTNVPEQLSSGIAFAADVRLDLSEANFTTLTPTNAITTTYKNNYTYFCDPANPTVPLKEITIKTYADNQIEDSTVFGVMLAASQKNISFEVPLYVTMAVTGGFERVTAPGNYTLKNTSVNNLDVGVIGMQVEKVTGSGWNLVAATPATDKEMQLAIAGIPLPPLANAAAPIEVINLASNANIANVTTGVSPLGQWLNGEWVPTRIAKDQTITLPISGTVQSIKRTDAGAAAQFIVTYVVSAMDAGGTSLINTYAGNSATQAGFVDPRTLN